jgi:hypothetical protein
MHVCPGPAEEIEREWLRQFIDILVSIHEKRNASEPDDAEWQVLAWAEYNGEPWQVDEFQSALMAALLAPIPEEAD